MKLITVTVLIGATLWIPEPLAYAENDRIFKARLSVMPLDDAARFRGPSTITGSGAVTATLTGTSLSITGTFEGMQAPATMARIHAGPKPGVRGPAIVDLRISSGPSGTISGAFDLTSDQVRLLEKSRFYVQLHSQISPDGNLWGWLMSPEGLQ